MEQSEKDALALTQNWSCWNLAVVLAYAGDVEIGEAFLQTKVKRKLQRNDTNKPKVLVIGNNCHKPK